MLPACSDLIVTLEEAREYYLAKLAGVRKITCHGKPVTIVFEREATHLYSDDPGSEPVEESQRVQRRIGGARVEVRRFNLDRARLMDRVLPAISNYTVSIPGTSTTRGREKRMLHGPLASEHCLRVVLRPGPGDAWTCVSAYPVSREVWLAACRAKRAKFPP